MPVHLETEVQIPPDAGPSFAASDNYLEWHVSLDLAIARFPDWGQKKEVVVSP